MQSLGFKVVGIEPLLLNNPQMVMPFNKYKVAIAKINKKTKKTDQDILDRIKLEVEAKVYFDDGLKVYIPSRWIIAAIAKSSWGIKRVSKDKIFASVFITRQKMKLNYKDQNKVDKLEDISGNEAFYTMLNLPQSGRSTKIRVPKGAPIFENWSFDCDLEYDESIVDKSDLVDILNYACAYGGFGDFRPTYGRAKLEVI